MEMLFEGLRVGSVNFINSAICSLFLSGRTTGISMEFGHNSSTIVPIYEGLILNHALFSDSYGGNYSNKVLLSYLEDPKLLDFEN